MYVQLDLMLLERPQFYTNLNSERLLQLFQPLDSMLRQSSTKIFALLSGMLEARTRFDLSGDITSKTHKALFL